MLNFMSENKRIFNTHEKRFSELENFQANITVFQTNTNDSLRNLETQVEQLALSLQNQSRNAFLDSTETNPKDFIPLSLRGDNERKQEDVGGKRHWKKIEEELLKQEGHTRRC